MKINKITNYLACPFLDVNNKKSTSGVNLPVLDGVRGLAVLIVLASHSNAFCMYGQGSLGVLLFFFLSGFVLIIPFYENPKIIFQVSSFFKYFRNRAFRIVPAYVVIVGIIAIVQNTGYEWYLWNISFVKGWNHLWSVAEEVRFYLLFPVVIMCMALFKNRYMQFALVAIIIYLSYKLRNEHKIDMMDGRYVGFYFYMFMGGALTYMAVNLPILKEKMNNIALQKIFSIAAFVILLSFLFSSMELVKEFWRPLFHNLPENLVLNGWRIPHIWLLLFIILFFTLTFYQTTLPQKILNSYFLRHIGLLSYSIYLCHMIILFKLKPLGFREEGLFFAVLVLSYLVSFVSYICVEKPFLLLKKRLSPVMTCYQQLQKK